MSSRLVDALDQHTIHCWWLPYHRQQGRQPLLEVLGRYLGLEPAQVGLQAGAHGRPGLAAGLHPDLDFNWSHSGEHAAIAIARGITVGIDIEAHRRRPRMLDLAQRYFTPAEALTLQQLEGEAREQAFWSLWTSKEAVLKATGEGIVYGLHRVAFAAPPWPWRLLQVGDQAACDWQLQRPQLDSGYTAALAWRGSPRQIELVGLD